MACYIRPHSTSTRQQPFNPLLSFLEDFATQFQPDNAGSTPPHQRHQTQQSTSSSSTKNISAKKADTKPTPTYAPRFDIVESETAYELYGELPGVKAEDLGVEFSDEKTLVVSGSSARTGATAASATSAAAVDSETKTTADVKGKAKEKQAAVEDADDFEDLSDSATTSAAATPDSTSAPDPDTESPEDLETTNANNNTTTTKQLSQPEHKFLLSERKYGTFSRTFQFQLPVEKEEVSARLRDGVLIVVVPKRVVRSQIVRVVVD